MQKKCKLDLFPISIKAGLILWRVVVWLQQPDASWQLQPEIYRENLLEII